MRKGDTVVILAGKDAGKRGTVDKVMRRRGTTYGRHRLPQPGAPSLSQAHVVIQGLNMAKRATKPRQSATQNQVAGVPNIQPGGILDIAQPLPLSRVMIVCPRCDKPTGSGTSCRRTASACASAATAANRWRAPSEPPAPALPGRSRARRCRSSSATTTRCRCRASHKIVVNVGLGEALTNAKAIDSAVGDLALITGQKPIVTRARRSIAQFRVRTGNAIGAMVTLRGERMWDFLERLTTLALPRIRDFRGVPGKSFDGRGNFSLGCASNSYSRRSTTTRWTVSAGWRSAS